jgi:hypothetical protein
MNDTEILDRLFKSRARVMPTIDPHGKRYVILAESAQANSSIRICHLPDDAFVVNVDKFEGPNHVFQCSVGECKRADFAIISESYRSILYIELKSGSCVKGEVIQQLMGARCFIRYCKEIVGLFWDNGNFMNGYSERFVSFVKIAASQRPITEISSNLHDCPARFLKIKHPDRSYQNFNKLIGAPS